MSVVGIGTDMVAVERIARMQDAHGERLAVRLLAPAELAEYQDTESKAAFLARRFAAKEAAAKALGCGIGGRAGFHDLVVTHTPAGAPLLKLSGVARKTAAALEVTATHLSITDEQDHAMAFVVLEGYGASGSTASSHWPFSRSLRRFCCCLAARLSRSIQVKG